MKHCGKDAVLNQALGKEFWYCQVCKQEVVEAPAETDIDPRDYSSDPDYYFSDSEETKNLQMEAEKATLEAVKLIGQRIRRRITNDNS